MFNSQRRDPQTHLVTAKEHYREWLLLAIAVALFGYRVWDAYSRVKFPFQIDYEEGNILNAASRIIHGVSPYATPGSFPYVLNCYGPVGYLLSVAGIKMFGFSLFGPRLLVMIAGILIAVLIGVIVQHATARRHVSVLAGLIFLCSPLVYYWLPLLRVDFWAIFCSLLAVYVFVRNPQAWPIAAAVCGVAILTKHTAIAAPMAIVLELLGRKQRARALAFCTVIVGLVLLCMVCLGPNFVFALLKTHPDPYRITLVLQSYFTAAYRCVLLLAIILYALLAGFRWTARIRPCWLYLIMCTGTALSVGKLGSNTNHMLELTAAVCILGGLALGFLCEKNDVLAHPFATGVLCLALIFIGMFRSSWYSWQTDFRDCGRAYDFVHSFEGERVLSENISALALSGKPVLVSNPFVVTQLGDSVDWQAGTLDTLVKRKYFDLVILGGELKDFRLESGTFSPEVIKQLDLQYAPVARFQCPSASVAFIPKGDDRIRSASLSSEAN